MSFVNINDVKFKAPNVLFHAISNLLFKLAFPDVLVGIISKKVHVIPNSVQSSLPSKEFNIQSVVLNPQNKDRSQNDPCLLLNDTLSLSLMTASDAPDVFAGGPLMAFA